MTHTGPVLPLKNTVVYPQIVVPLAVGRAASLAAVAAGTEAGRQVIVVAQRRADQENPALEDLRSIGTLANINRVEHRDKGAQVIVQGARRVRLLALAETTGEHKPDHLRVHYELLPDLQLNVDTPDRTEIEALLRENLQLSQEIAQLFDPNNGLEIYQQLVGSLSDPIAQMYRIASLANLDLDQEQAVLECDSSLELMQKLHQILQHEFKVTEMRKQIAEQARGDLDQQQREHVLRQQKRAIEQALGETGDDEDTAELRSELEKANLPANVQKEVDRELKRLARMSANAADYQVSRGYLELIAELPWSVHTDDQLDLIHAREVLDTDHFGLEDIKERILESLAVMQLNVAAKSPIICLVGPPGVGKTSLGQSIARAMGRKFERISLGGLHDEAELRGHRRTYIGAMPGRILQAIRRAGVCNPLLMLDEVDKLGRDFRGDPSAALMEILDPTQNQGFQDNYLNLPFDLSNVLFITTANTLEGIPRPLLDRMEILRLAGYSDSEKLSIARQYLIPRQQLEAGLGDNQFVIDDDSVRHIVRRYSREAGVRELERVIGRLARKRARQVVEKHLPLTPINESTLVEFLGPPKFHNDSQRARIHPGVATGLAWTEVGGEVLYVEASLTAKADKITLTGQLGQVMQESVHAARSYLWAHAEQFGIDRESLENNGLHIHVPQGAVPKDGPSAGVTMAIAIISLFRGVPVRADLAMTGELTLTGLVLPVGGIKEKILAAHRAGLKTVILPKDNAPDLAELPENVSNELDFILASELSDVAAAAFPSSA